MQGFASGRALRFAVPVVASVGAGIIAWGSRIPPERLRDLLLRWEFWLLEGLFVGVAITTLIEARRLRVSRPVVYWALTLGLLTTAVTALVPPATSRIYYDEQIYQGVAQNLTDLHLAQMCNEGTLDYGRLQCSQAEFNKEPNGYPYLLSLAYRVVGVREGTAFIVNNLVAGLSVFIVVLLGAMLFQDTRAAVLGGLVLSLLPMQLWWSNTASAEPSAALMTAGALLAAVHFTQTRTGSALAWTVALTAFATTIRPESVLVVPLTLTAVALLAPGEFRRPAVWLAGAVGLVLLTPTLLHLLSVRDESWGAPAARFGWQYVQSNLPGNLWFYLGRDERFPALVSAAALLGVVSARQGRRELLLLVTYEVLFWGVFVTFYAGSYYYGADVRYSVLSNGPLAVLAGRGLASVADFMSRWMSSKRATAGVAAATLLQFSWYLPVARSVGEEAWAARADVAYARQFARALPPNAIVLTHNPSMFHVWGVSAAQLSLAQAVPAYVKTQVFDRHAGGVYLHWNFWCNVSDPVQTGYCKAALDAFQSHEVASARQGTYEYRMYRLDVPTAP